MADNNNDYEIQFEAKDIVAKIRELRGVKPNKKIERTIFGYSVAPDGKIHKLLTKLDNYFYPDKEKNIMKKLSGFRHNINTIMPNASEYVESVLEDSPEGSLSEAQKKSLEKLVSNTENLEIHVNGVSNAESENSLIEEANSMEKALLGLSNSLPIIPKLETEGQINDSIETYMGLLDSGLKMIIYSINQTISPNFQRDSYFLHQDLKVFQSVYNNETGVNSCLSPFIVIMPESC
ncbi:hypothetical protein ACFLTH_17660, partial [Bacteroidota bacterium]